MEHSLVSRAANPSEAAVLVEEIRKALVPADDLPPYSEESALRSLLFKCLRCFIELHDTELEVAECERAVERAEGSLWTVKTRRIAVACLCVCHPLMTPRVPGGGDVLTWQAGGRQSHGEPGCAIGGWVRCIACSPCDTPASVHPHLPTARLRSESCGG